jgi:hypothetical protein
LYSSYYVGNTKKGEDDFELFLSSLLLPDGVLAAQVGDAVSLNTAATGNPDMEGYFAFANNLRKNGFLRINDYEEVCINLFFFFYSGGDINHTSFCMK